MQTFEEWQNDECKWLGISKQDHDRILGKCKQIQAAGFGWPYDTIVDMMKVDILSWVEKFNAEEENRILNGTGEGVPVGVIYLEGLETKE